MFSVHSQWLAANAVLAMPAQVVLQSGRGQAEVCHLLRQEAEAFVGSPSYVHRGG